MANEVPVFSLWNEFVGWVLDHTEKFPKKVRFSFSTRIEKLTLDVLEDIVRASYSGEKREYLQRINLNLSVLRVLVRLCCDREYLTPRAYEFATRKINEAGQMIGGWLRSYR